MTAPVGGLIGMVWAWAVLCAAPVAAQEITESWVAQQLGRSQPAGQRELSATPKRGLPVLSLMIRYLPATGELTLASANALHPLYHALNTLAPATFRVVCCTGLPPAREQELAQQLAGHLSRLFAGRQRHVQFHVNVQNPLTSERQRAADPTQAPVARIDVYRLP